MKLPPHFVASIAKLRISAHDLEIERGRYFTPSIPANMRFCKICKDIVENEIHFVTECPLYNELRKEILDKCIKADLHIGDLTDNNDLFVHILTTDNFRVISSLGHFLVKCFEKRKDALFKHNETASGTT
jgi:hypothetical protein